MPELIAQVGKKIRFFRKSANLSQEKLSEITRIEQSYLAKIERGEVNTTLESIEKIAKALKISPHELFEIDKNLFRKDKKDAIEKIDIFLASKAVEELKLIYKIVKDIYLLKETK